MLLELAVSNYAIIDDLAIRFGPGFTALTGETGAGKSIVVGAIGLLLGGRAMVDVVRTGEDEAMVEGRLDVSNRPEVLALLEQGDFMADDELVIRRTVSRSGRGRCTLNGRLAPVSMLKEIGTKLLNIYGQFEYQSLLQVERHLELLDAFGGLQDLRAEVRNCYSRTADLLSRLNALAKQEQERAKREDYLRFVIGEIQKVGLEPDEEQRLKNRKSLIVNSQKIRELSDSGLNLLYDDEGSVHERLSEYIHRLGELSAHEAIFKKVEAGLLQSLYQIEEARDHLLGIAGHLEFDPGELQEIEDRLALLGDLKRKYGRDIPAVLAHLAQCQSELHDLTSTQQRRTALAGEFEKSKARLISEAEQLTKKRQQTALRLSRAMADELATLEMKDARFQTAIEPLAGGGEQFDLEHLTIGPRGADRVEFLLSANPGEEPKPLARIASGGELSRIMLAFKRVLGGLEKVPTLIFDEVDTGIGGQMAEVVGRKLADVALNHQVLVVTHLPQIARWANDHFYLGKKTVKGRTRTEAVNLKGEKRIEEIARMMVGERITETTLAHAREMLADQLSK